MKRTRRTQALLLGLVSAALYPWLERESFDLSLATLAMALVLPCLWLCVLWLLFEGLAGLVLKPASAAQPPKPWLSIGYALSVCACLWGAELVTAALREPKRDPGLDPTLTKAMENLQEHSREESKRKREEGTRHDDVLRAPDAAVLAH